mgnify:CR=1 FL=1
MSRKTTYGSTAGWLSEGVIKTEDLGRRSAFMKKKPVKPLTAEVVTEEVVLQPVDEAENHADGKLRKQERIKQRPLPPPPVKPTN